MNYKGSRPLVRKLRKTRKLNIKNTIFIAVLRVLEITIKMKENKI